ncbi:nucleoside triphosphate pyrophosphohydrolase [Bacillus shivajii]|uniref:nucleoside triphosphate pyrophosphohydrolase n=1 Tax=Bacillus shivajii TaxID=1983719 RepID=UPI001CF973AA|nr:nucleoside triphosphate pyrophosphohydrolase [Bacillus shivajii]UCZ53315.1 nucleoside triphosphate pyrophosphohydrolase [Bacillus shivajii]
MKNKIVVLGLGAGNIDQLPLGIYRNLKDNERLFVRTQEHPVLQDLMEEGLSFTSFDHIYESHDQFHEVYDNIVKTLIEEAKQQELTYAVPGHPFVAEETVQRLLERARENEVELEFIGGQSFLDAMFNALHIDPVDGFQLVDGTMMKKGELQLRHHIVISQVYDAFIASEVKLTLMDILPDDYEVKVVTAAGNEDERILEVPLYELDRVTTLNNLTAVYVPPIEEERLLYHDFQKLREVIATLRGPGGCPWDQEQTHESLKKYLIEEAYEVLSAIDEGDEDHLAEELGDVLLQVMLHAQIGEDDGYFTVDHVISHVTEKMIRRHPHVFSDVNVEGAEDVVTNWEEIKKLEKEDEGLSHSLLADIPNEFPSLLKAYKVQKKAAKVGFDWGEEAPIWMKIQEEIAEWIYELRNGTEDTKMKELGDVFFALVNLARFYKIDPEEALRQTNAKFIRRFQYIEQKMDEKGLNIDEQPLEELDRYWEQAKKQG